MTTQNACLPFLNASSSPNLPPRYERLWRAIEEAIEESVFILLGKCPGEADQATRKIRALESAGRTLARSQKIREQMLPEEPQMHGSPQFAVPTSQGLSPSKAVGQSSHSPTALPMAKTESAFSDKSAAKFQKPVVPAADIIVSTEQIAIAPLESKSAPSQEPVSHPKKPVRQAVLPPTSKPEPIAPPSITPIKNSNLRIQNSPRLSALADFLLPENPLPEDSNGIGQLQDMAHRFLGSSLDAIAQNAKISLGAISRQTNRHSIKTGVLHRP